MARDHAQIKAGLWRDPDFLGLSSQAQRVYLLALSQPDLNDAGVIDYSARRWAGKSMDTTSADIEKAVLELSEARFVIADEDQDELWIRTYVKHERIAEKPNMVVAMSRNFSAIRSERIRDAFLDELGPRWLDQFDGQQHKTNQSSEKALLSRLSQPFMDGFLHRFPEPIPQGMQEPIPLPIPPGFPHPLIRAPHIPTSTDPASLHAATPVDNLDPEPPDKPGGGGPPPGARTAEGGGELSTSQQYAVSLAVETLANEELRNEQAAGRPIINPRAWLDAKRRRLTDEIGPYLAQVAYAQHLDEPTQILRAHRGTKTAHNLNRRACTLAAQRALVAGYDADELADEVATLCGPEHIPAALQVFHSSRQA